MARSTALIAIATTLLTLCACGDDDQATRTPRTVDDYLAETGPAVNAVADAFQEWSRASDELARIDQSSLSNSEIRQLAEEERDALLSAENAVSAALDDIRSVTPPSECEHAHDLVVDVLRLSQQGYGEIIRYLTNALDDDRLEETVLENGKALLRRSDETRARLRTEAGECS